MYYRDMDIKRLGEIAKISSGSTPARNNQDFWNGDIPWVSTGELSSGFVNETREHVSLRAVHETSLKLLKPGTLLMAMYGQGKTRGIVSRLNITATTNQACASIEIKKDEPSYVYYFLQFRYESIRKLSNGGSQENLSTEIIKKIKISLPPIAEQRKIAEILSAQDRVIELKTKLLEEKKRLKKYLCQLIMGGNKIKLARGYSVRLLSSITKKKLIKNKDLKYSVVLSNSAKYGIVPQNVQFDKNIANEENIDRYYVAEIGDFIYNPRISTSAPCGPINQNDCCDGVVSPLYTVFSCSAECVCDKYLKYYFQTSLWHEYIQSVANTGARYDRMNVSDKDFFSMAINLPPLNTQRQCVVLLDAFSNVIKLMEENLEQEKLKKKALMQQMLTGKVRVTV